jgi:hypothetical protein
MSFEGFLLFLILKKRNGRDSNQISSRLIINILSVFLKVTHQKLTLILRLFESNDIL